ASPSTGDRNLMSAPWEKKYCLSFSVISPITTPAFRASGLHPSPNFRTNSIAIVSRLQRQARRNSYGTRGSSLLWVRGFQREERDDPDQFLQRDRLFDVVLEPSAQDTRSVFRTAESGKGGRRRRAAAQAWASRRGKEGRTRSHGVMRFTGVRVVGRDMSTVPFSLSLRRSLRDRAVAARPAGASQNDSGDSGSRHPSGGCASLHLATCGRKVEADAPCDDPASKARDQLVTSMRWTSDTQVSTCIKAIFTLTIPVRTLGNRGLIYPAIAVPLSVR